MSYILDALKKAEAEQDPAAAASLAVSQQRNQSRQRLTGILVGAALLANVAVLLWLFGPTELTAPAATATPAPSPAAMRAPATTPTIRASEEPLAEPAAEREPEQQISARLADLPTKVRSRFPGLAFSTHIYADDPSLRAVVANGKRMVEGDEIGGAAITQITDDGVVLAFENYLVEIPIVADWE
jgi:general secretion pathway protein B